LVIILQPELRTWNTLRRDYQLNILRMSHDVFTNITFDPFNIFLELPDLIALKPGLFDLFGI
jgi:hypothetical protein